MFDDLSYGYMGFGGGLMMLIFWVFLIAFIVWLVKESRGGNHSDAGRSQSPLDLLKERYVKGEIDKKEFEEKKKDLNN